MYRIAGLFRRPIFSRIRNSSEFRDNFSRLLNTWLHPYNYCLWHEREEGVAARFSRLAEIRAKINVREKTGYTVLLLMNEKH